MKVKINVAIQIQELCEKFSNHVIKAKTAYKFAKLLKSASSEVDFYRAQYTLYIQKYSEKEENGNIKILENGNIKILPEMIEECKQKLEELENLEVDFPDVSFSLEELEELNMTMRDILILDAFITE